MSQERFIKYFPSQESLYLLLHQPNAFRLLTIIAMRARRDSGNPDGLLIGECHLGDWKEIGMTRQEYRTALQILIARNHSKIMETNRTRKKSTTGTTTKGTKVKLLSSNVYDINIEIKNHSINHRATTDQPLTNHDQEIYKNDKNDKNDQSSLPSFLTKEVIDDFFPKKEKGIELYKEVFLTQKEIDECVKMKGSLENVKECIRQVMESPGRKMNIKNWISTLRTWNFKNTAKINIQQNYDLGGKLQEIYGDYNPWKVRVYRDNLKDENGVLFEASGAQTEPVFISFSDGNFSQKANEFIKLKKMKKIGVWNE